MSLNRLGPTDAEVRAGRLDAAPVRMNMPSVAPITERLQLLISTVMPRSEYLTNREVGADQPEPPSSCRSEEPQLVPRAQDVEAAVTLASDPTTSNQQHNEDQDGVQFIAENIRVDQDMASENGTFIGEVESTDQDVKVETRCTTSTSDQQRGDRPDGSNMTWHLCSTFTSDVESTDRDVNAGAVETRNTTSSSDQQSGDRPDGSNMPKGKYNQTVKCNNADGTKRYPPMSERLNFLRPLEEESEHQSFGNNIIWQLRYLVETRCRQLVGDGIISLDELRHPLVIAIGHHLGTLSYFEQGTCLSHDNQPSISQSAKPEKCIPDTASEVTERCAPTPDSDSHHSASESSKSCTSKAAGGRRPKRTVYGRKAAKNRQVERRRGATIAITDPSGAAKLEGNQVANECSLPPAQGQDLTKKVVPSLSEAASLSDTEEETQSDRSSSQALCLDSPVLILFRRHAQRGKHPVMCLPTQDYTFSPPERTSQNRSTRNSSSRARLPENNPARDASPTRVRFPEDKPTRDASPTRDRLFEHKPTESAPPRDRLPSDLYEFDLVTQLLHASDYNQIIGVLGDISSSLPPERLMMSHFIDGIANFKLAKHEEARRHFQQCESTAYQLPLEGNIMLCNAYLGDIEYASRSYLKAAEHYKVAIERYSLESMASIFKLTPPSLSAIHAKRASCFRNVARMVEAVREYKLAIEKAQIDRDRLSAHTSLGNLYQSMGDNSNALIEYKESIALAEKLSDYVSLGWAHGNIGNAYLGLNKKDEAVYHLQKSLDLAVKYEQTPQAIGRTYNNLGTAYQSMNDLDEAKEYYDLALSQAEYGNDKPGQARVYGNIGNVYMLRKNYEQAIPHYSEVLNLSNDPSTVSTAQHNRGCAYYEWATSLHPRCSRKLRVHGPECDIDSCLKDVPKKAYDLYYKGSLDLKEVVKYHEDRFQYIKGSPQGLTMSVSLFEANSRTFHRLQDCLVNLHKWDEALTVAEQSRARTLGELMLTREASHQISRILTSPLSFDQITSIIEKQECPLIYLSYTGARLLGWVFAVRSRKLTMNSFELCLSDDQCDGKSFDYYLRYTLTEKLVEHSFEMYKSIAYDEDSSSPVQMLHKLVAAPIEGILDKSDPISANEQVICVSDSYTTLLPLTCLHNVETGSFFGDKHVFRLAPSLLSLGIMDHITETTITLEDDEQELCVIGDPSIPPFVLNKEVWNLGKLPFARKEAEWVAHMLQTTPILNENATKTTLFNRAMRAKLIHIATHGSASAGFLAFASFSKSTRSAPSQFGNYLNSENVLLYPEEVEKLHISPALVVLSSCDSGRGTVKADGIQGMARAFILGGAQSVLTTLWKVPDESASVFMQFFYQYLMDGVHSSFALQKAILSVRCFAKYSQYIHWSGYQLTGRDIQISRKETDTTRAIRRSLGQNSVFPHIAIVKQLEKALLKNPVLPTDIQIVKGPPGVKPSEIVIDFITSFHQKFRDGIFWLNCYQKETTEAGIKYIEQVIGCGSLKRLLHTSENHEALVVLDGLSSLPESEPLLETLKGHHVHIIAIIDSCVVDIRKVIKEADVKLIRGCTQREVPPLSVIHSQQRIVHSIMTDFSFTPGNYDQQVFEKLAEFTVGSPVLVDIVTQVARDCFESTDNPMQQLDKLVMTSANGNSVEEHEADTCSSDYDSWKCLLQACKLEPEEKVLLNCLSLFSAYPVSLSVVIQLSSLISSRTPNLAGTLHQNLVKYRLLCDYPLPVVHSTTANCNLQWLHVPKHVSQCIWATLEDLDRVVVFTVMLYALKALCKAVDNDSSDFLCEACSCLKEKAESKFSLIGKECYKEIYSLWLRYTRT